MIELDEIGDEIGAPNHHSRTSNDCLPGNSEFGRKQRESSDPNQKIKGLERE
jgi:hypothetical protein